MAPNLDSFGRDRALYQEHAKRRIAEREARRTRRRQAREQTGKMADHLEGLSSDDEETSTDITNFNLEKTEFPKSPARFLKMSLRVSTPSTVLNRSLKHGVQNTTCPTKTLTSASVCPSCSTPS